METVEVVVKEEVIENSSEVITVKTTTKEKGINESSSDEETSGRSSGEELLKEAERELKKKLDSDVSCSSSPVSPAGEDTPADFYGDLKQKMVHIKVCLKFP